MRKENRLKKRWYKFLIYFALWAIAFIYFVIGLMLIYGTHYKLIGLSTDKVYDYYSDLKQLDTFFGIVNIFISVYIIIVRYYLSNLKFVAPKMLLTMHVAIVFFNLLYIIVFPTKLNHISNLYNILWLIINVSVMIFNYVYFEKCKFAFIN